MCTGNAGSEGRRLKQRGRGGAMNPIKEVLKRQRGIASYCTSNELVLEACMEEAGKDGYVLVEATANQVNQFGGYTGMNAADFVKYAERIAERSNLPKGKLLLGGDHLGPLVWSSEPEETAMEKAEQLVREFVQAGFQKFHLDTSMRLGDDDSSKPLSTETIAKRGVRLYRAAMDGFEERKRQDPKAELPVFIIGSEVPIPGGSQEAEESVQVTKPEAFEETVEVYKRVFDKAGFTDAFEHIIAVVVQPGVEFGDSSVCEYDRGKAEKLTKALQNHPGFIFEGHSTDYQKETSLREMTEDGIAILKVGPALTFALREGLFQLEAMEKELYPEYRCSHFSMILEQVMLEQPGHWKKHYNGTEEEKHLARKYSYSDRCRYYIGDERVEQAMEHLFRNLDTKTPSDSMLHQYMPEQYRMVRDGTLPREAKALAKAAVRQVVAEYQKSVGARN